MTIYCLATTKIGKGMRHIIDKDVIPRQEEFRFQEGGKVLVEHWSWLLTARRDDSTKCCGYLDSGDVSVNMSIIHDIIRERRRNVGSGDGLR